MKKKITQLMEFVRDRKNLPITITVMVLLVTMVLGLLFPNILLLVLLAAGFVIYTLYQSARKEEYQVRSMQQKIQVSLQDALLQGIWQVDNSHSFCMLNYSSNFLYEIHNDTSGGVYRTRVLIPRNRSTSFSPSELDDFKFKLQTEIDRLWESGMIDRQTLTSAQYFPCHIITVSVVGNRGRYLFVEATLVNCAAANGYCLGIAAPKATKSVSDNDSDF